MLACAVLGMMLVLSASAVPRGPDASAMVVGINAERAAERRGSLQIDATLTAVALEHALDMAHHDYFGHLGPSGLSPFARLRNARLRFAYAGEDLELDRDEPSAERALWNSEPHRRNALEPYFNHVGAAAVCTARGEFFVEEFSG